VTLVTKQNSDLCHEDDAKTRSKLNPIWGIIRGQKMMQISAKITRIDAKTMQNCNQNSTRPKNDANRGKMTQIVRK
jgi:hypothetical protein